MVQTRIQGTEALNQALYQKLLAWEKDEKPRSSAPTGVSRHNLYESDFSLFRRNDPDIQRLARICLGAVGNLVKQMNGYSVNEMQSLRIYDHSWYHITRSGGYFGAHNHPMASWSGVYCVTPGGHSPYPDSGVLRFIENRTTANMYLDPGNAHLAAPYAFGDLNLSLVPGLLVLFPSYLLHEVTPFHGPDVRITVAFNCWLRHADEPIDEPGVRQRSQPK